MPQAPTDPVYPSSESDKTSLFIIALALLLSVYSLTYTGYLRIDDEHILMSRSQSLALSGIFTEPQVYGNSRVQELLALDEAAVQIEPLQTIISAPVYWLAVQLGLGGAQAVMLLPILLTVMTAAAIGLSVGLLGFSSRTVVWCVLLFGLGSMAWPYALTYFRDVLTMFMASLVFLGWCLVHHAQRVRRLLGILIIALGTLGAIASKNTGVLLIPALLTAVSYLLFRSKSGQMRGRIFVGGVLSGLLIVLVWTQIQLSGPFARFDASYYITTGQFFLRNLSLNTLLATLGPFFSPVRSIFVFSPVLLLAVFSIPGWRDRLWFAIPALLYALFLALAQALFYGERWAGVLYWGLRYMLPAIPGLIILAAPMVEQLLLTESGWRRFVLPAILVVGAVIQISGSLVDWREFNRFLASSATVNSQLAPDWNPAFSPIPFHILSLLYPSRWALSIRYGVVQHPWITVVTILMGLSVIILALRQLAWTPRLPNATFGKYLVVGLALIIPIVIFLGAQGDPRWGGGNPAYRSALLHMNPQMNAGDAVVLDSYSSKLWFYGLNYWSARHLWYALPTKLPSDQGERGSENGQIIQVSERLFELLEGQKQRLWYLSSDESPAEVVAADLGYLTDRFPLLFERRFTDGTQVNLYLFHLAQ